MDFLSKIKRHLQNRKNSSFRKNVQQEKKQKYLFRDDESAKYTSSRQGIFSRQKKTLAPFTSSIIKNTNDLKRKVTESRILAYLGVILLILSGYIIGFSPYFKISPSHVLLEADSPSIDISIAYRSIEEIYGKSIFLIDEKDVAITIQKSLKNISRITIDKLYPNGIKILLKGAPIKYKATLFGNEKEWGMSENGVFVPKIESTSSGSKLIDLTIVSEKLKGEIFLDYKEGISDTNMLLISKILELFQAEWADLKIAKLIYFERENELHIALENTTKIILTLEDESGKPDYAVKIAGIKNQLIGLKTYIDANRKIVTDGSIRYIDARIVKKLFICRETENCKKNLISVYGDVYR